MSTDTLERDNVRILRWPWALGEASETVLLGSVHSAVPFEGITLLACPLETKIFPIGGSADLARLARTGQWDLYELPHGRTGSIESSLEMQAYTGGRHARWLVTLDGARTRFDRARLESAESIAVFDWWDAFDDLLNQGEKPDGAILWSRVWDWLGQRSKSSDPRRSLIVEIAESLGSSIGDRARHLRRILLRRREIVSVQRINQLDEECLRWYIRQPGETLAEKAGHRQELMSVVRQETFDTLENRVLKDLLRRCIRASARYLQRFQKDFPNSGQILRVRRFAQTCDEALCLPEMEGIRRPRPGFQPNYVLQSDERYREIWRWYKKLLQNQDSEDQIWSWQSRLWADVCRLLLGSACYLKLVGEKKLDFGESLPVRAPFFINRESVLGSRLIRAWGPGPLPVRRGSAFGGVLSVVGAREANDHPIVAKLLGIGGHSYLVIEALGNGAAPCDVLVVWAVNSLATSRKLNAQEVIRSAKQALHRIWDQTDKARSRIRRLDGLVLVSALGGNTKVHSGLGRVVNGESSVLLLEIGSDPKCWDDAVFKIADGLEQWL